MPGSTFAARQAGSQQAASPVSRRRIGASINVAGSRGEIPQSWFANTRDKARLAAIPTTIPMIAGRVGDIFGLRAGLMFLYLTLGCVLSVGFWAKPLILNRTIDAKCAEARAAV